MNTHIPCICERCNTDYFALLGDDYIQHTYCDKTLGWRCICTYCRTDGEKELWAEPEDHLNQMDISEPPYADDPYASPADSDRVQREWESHRRG